MLEHIFVTYVFPIAYISMGVAVLTAIVFPIIHMIQYFKKARTALIGIGIMVVIYGICFLIAFPIKYWSDWVANFEAMYLVEAAMFAFYTLLVIAILAILFTYVYKIIKNFRIIDLIILISPIVAVIAFYIAYRMAIPEVIAKALKDGITLDRGDIVIKAIESVFTRYVFIIAYACAGVGMLAAFVFLIINIIRNFYEEVMFLIGIGVLAITYSICFLIAFPIKNWGTVDFDAIYLVEASMYTCYALMGIAALAIASTPVFSKLRS